MRHFCTKRKFSHRRPRNRSKAFPRTGARARTGHSPPHLRAATLTGGEKAALGTPISYREGPISAI
ncbi:hypothetical protein CDO31_02835 [Sinorhizobium meliloti]|nr:hypothetical protein CDO31_02835 [Sinorhizobium meliloti]